MNELRALRLRKDELESHLTTLQDSRRQLMIQLEGLMKMLKNHQSSPKSTPNSSPRSTKSPPHLASTTPTSTQPGQRSAPQTPLTMTAPTNVTANQERLNMSGQERSCERVVHNNDALVGVGGDVRNAFGGSNNVGRVAFYYSFDFLGCLFFL